MGRAIPTLHATELLPDEAPLTRHEAMHKPSGSTNSSEPTGTAKRQASERIARRVRPKDGPNNPAPPRGRTFAWRSPLMGLYSLADRCMNTPELPAESMTAP
jgi:hypothetical protein